MFLKEFFYFSLRRLRQQPDQHSASGLLSPKVDTAQTEYHYWQCRVAGGRWTYQTRKTSRNVASLSGSVLEIELYDNNFIFTCNSVECVYHWVLHARTPAATRSACPCARSRWRTSCLCWRRRRPPRPGAGPRWSILYYVMYVYLLYLYLYLHISLLFTIPGGEAARPDHLHHHQPQPGNFILLQT